LIRGRNIYHYADKSIEIDGPTLIFFNPQVPYTWEPVSGDQTGFSVFSEKPSLQKILGVIFMIYQCLK